MEFVFGMDANPRFVRRAEQLAEEQWAPFERDEAPPPRRKRPTNVKKAIVERRGFRELEGTRMPVAEFDANWAYLVIACLAWNLKAWAGLLLPSELGARSILRMEFRRFLDEIVLLPAQILRTGRRLVFRLLAINRWVPLLLEGTQRLKRRCPA